MEVLEKNGIVACYFVIDALREFNKTNDPDVLLVKH